MAQQIRGLAALPEDLGLTHSTSIPKDLMHSSGSAGTISAAGAQAHM